MDLLFITEVDLGKFNGQNGTIVNLSRLSLPGRVYMHDNELSNIKMNKKIIKYVSRVVCGLITVFFGLTTVVALFPDESYHLCEAGQAGVYRQGGAG